MIKCKKGTLKLKGTTDELLSEMGGIVSGVHKILSEKLPKEAAKVMILSVVDFSMMDEEEQQKKLFQTMNEKNIRKGE